MVNLINRTLIFKFMYYIRPNKFIPPPSFHISEPKFWHAKQNLHCASTRFCKTKRFWIDLKSKELLTAHFCTARKKCTIDL